MAWIDAGLRDLKKKKKWQGLAVNEGQTKSGKPHKDYADAKEAFNCVIPYGDWQGGKIILWDLKQ